MRLCRSFQLNHGDICSHREAALSGYASNHGDPESWMKHFGDDMEAFRRRVAEKLAANEPHYTAVVRHLLTHEMQLLQGAWPNAEIKEEEHE